MKNIFRYTFAAMTAVAMVTACDLDLVPTTSIAYEEGGVLFQTANDIKAFENGILASYRELNYNSSQQQYCQAAEVMFDGFNATADYGNNYGSEHRCDYTFDASTYEATYVWRYNYQAIKNYNIVIENADNVDESLKTSAQIMKGEAYFFRASSYITLARHFGVKYNASSASSDLCVPLVLKYDQLESPARATVAEVYASIKSDLDNAAALLAGVKGAARSQKPTIDAVNALYARYYLDIKDYADAAKYAETVISTNNYKLASTAEEMAKEYTNDSGTEPIMQMYASQSEGTTKYEVYTECGNDSKEGIYFASYFIPTKKLVSAYSSDDLRFKAWFAKDLYPTRILGTFHKNLIYTFIKYMDNPDLRTGSVPTGAHAFKPLLISEMYLIAAEAYAQSNNPDKAAEKLNALQIARNASVTSGDMENIKNEWFRETVGEGLRFSCLKRWGDGCAVRTPQDGAADLIMTGDAYEKRALSASDYHFNWPVPTYELQVNKNLVQNAGYAAVEE